MKKNCIKRLGLFIILPCIILISSCNKDGYSITESGLRYHFYESKGLQKPNEGDILKLQLVYKTLKDSILYDSKILGDSFLIELTAPTSKGGLEEGFAMMGVGDSASFLVSADSVFDKLFRQQLPDFLHKGDMLRFDVRLQRIMTRSEMNQMLLQTAILKTKKETTQIEAYLKANNLPVTTTENGIYYFVFIDGKGILPKKGDDITLKYVVRTLDGVLIDTSDKRGGKINFKLGEGIFPDAWVSAISTMKKGGISRLILSSEHLKGITRFGEIPLDLPLIFDLELLDVKPQIAF